MHIPATLACIKFGLAGTVVMFEEALRNVLSYNRLDVIILPEGRMSMSLQVWVNAEMDSNGRVHFAADSDSELTRGLAAILVEALSGLTPEGVLQVCCATTSSHLWHVEYRLALMLACCKVYPWLS